MPLLETKKISKHFHGVKAVDNLSLAVGAGKITGIIGPNGSGKSTLVNVLTGVLPFESGMVVVGDVSLRALHPYDVASYGITRTFQEVRLFQQMTVYDNVLVVLTERNVFGSLFEHHVAFHEEEAERVLTRVGLWEKRDALAIHLSYGQRKLLELARALSMRASIYLFDEPFAGLFPEMIATVSAIMRELREEEKAVVLVEHNMNIIRDLCDYVYVLDSGALLAAGEPEEVLKQKDVIEAYLGE